MAGHENRRRNRQAQMDEQRRAAEEAARRQLEPVREELEAAKWAAEMVDKALRERLKELGGKEGELSKEEQKLEERRLREEFEAKRRLEMDKAAELKAAIRDGEEAGRAAGERAAEAIFEIAHAHNLLSNDPGDRLRHLAADHGDQLIAAGGVVATVVGVIYPPAGVIAGLAVAATAAAIRNEQAIAELRDEHRQQNMVVLGQAIEGRVIDRHGAQLLLEGQGWTTEEAVEMVEAAPEPPPDVEPPEMGMGTIAAEDAAPKAAKTTNPTAAAGIGAALLLVA